MEGRRFGENRVGIGCGGKPRTNSKGSNANEEEEEVDTIGLIPKSFIDVVSTVHVIYHNMKWGCDPLCRQLKVWKATLKKTVNNDHSRLT
jgi:hypothetical protein